MSTSISYSGVWAVGFSFYHKPHASNLELITYLLRWYEFAGNVLKCFDGFCSVISLSYANNEFNLMYICHIKLERIITRCLGKVGIMLRVNTTNSSTIEACLITDWSFRKTWIKQCNNIMCFSKNLLLLGECDGLQTWKCLFPPLI